MLVLAAGSYVAADVFDVVPGILTRATPAPAPTDAHAADATPGDAAPAIALPTPTATNPVLAPLDAQALDRDALERAITPTLADPALGPGVGVSIRDVATGEQVYAAGAPTARRVASTQKLLTAAAVAQVLDPAATMRTRVVSPKPGELVLVAGGDTMLAKGAGDPAAVAGHAGLADLVTQVVDGIRAQHEGTPEAGAPKRWTLRLDATFAAGPGYPDTSAFPPSWNPADVASGFTQTVAMLGFADQRPKPYVPSPMDPAGSVLTELGEQLDTALRQATGARVRVRDTPSLRATPAPADASELGAVESAAYRDVLATALDDSDNALTENLARQAALAQGRDGGFAGNAAFVQDTLAGLGYDVSGTNLVDTSGLAGEQTTTVALISQVIGDGLSGKLPGLADVLGRLPVAGLDGTLYDRFRTGPSVTAAGLARAKTGTLTGISSLAGTTVDAAGQQLAFVIVADRVPAATGTLEARAALDRFVVALTSCDCGTSKGTS